MKKIVAFLCLNAVFIPSLALAQEVPVQSDASKSIKTWQGVIELPNNQTLEFFIKVLSANSATISVPSQSAYDIPLTEFSESETEIHFIWNVPGTPTGVFQRNGAEAIGTFTQGGQSFPSKLKISDKPALPTFNRPQTPKAPFPYKSIEVSYINPDDGAKLSGTLSIPNAKGPHPVVVMITGSGPQDRDETILGHKPFLVIADYLTRQGIAVLRSDDRGVGGSTSTKNGQETSLDFADDVVSAINFLKTQPEIDQKHIGLIGHSEGGLIAPIVATKSSDVSFIVLLAGTGVSGKEILIRQTKDIYKSEGMDDALLVKIIEVENKIFDAISNNENDQVLRKYIEELAVLQMPKSDKEGMNDQQVQAIIDNGLIVYKSPWFKTFITLDPREYLQKTKVPVLAMNGSLDLQVAADQNLPEIFKALQKAENKDITIAQLPNLNHLFQTTNTGSISEYEQIEETFSQKALNLLAFWIKQHVFK